MASKNKALLLRFSIYIYIYIYIHIYIYIYIYIFMKGEKIENFCDQSLQDVAFLDINMKNVQIYFFNFNCSFSLKYFTF